MAGSGGASRSPGQVGEFSVLKKLPKSDEALQLLKKIHSLVAPIMKKHGWYLPHLAEFFPAESNLLGININRGAKICLRLRPAHDPSRFLDLEEYPSLVGTMLHELTHNIRGPHDKIFFDELAKLEDEFEGLQRGGYSGTGFFSDGKKVSTESHNLPMNKAREMAVKKAEERAKIQGIMGPSGGRRLGGAPPKGMRPGELALWAAERRKKAEASCGHGHGKEGDVGGGAALEDLPEGIRKEVEKADREGETTKAEVIQIYDSDDEDVEMDAGPSAKKKPASSSEPAKGTSNRKLTSSNSIVDLTGFSSDEDRPRASSSRPGSSTKNLAVKPVAASSSSSRPAPKAAARPAAAAPVGPPPTSFTCIACTFSNPLTPSFGTSYPVRAACDICSTQQFIERSGIARAPTKKDGWACGGCGKWNGNADFWTCEMCGVLKPPEA